MKQNRFRRQGKKLSLRHQRDIQETDSKPLKLESSLRRELETRDVGLESTDEVPEVNGEIIKEEKIHRKDQENEKIFGTLSKFKSKE